MFCLFKCIARLFVFCLFIIQPWFHPVAKYCFNVICFTRFIFVNSVIVSSIISFNNLYQDFIIMYVWYFVSRNSISVLGAIWPSLSPCTIIIPILLTYLPSFDCKIAKCRTLRIWSNGWPSWTIWATSSASSLPVSLLTAKLTSSCDMVAVSTSFESFTQAVRGWPFALIRLTSGKRETPFKLCFLF